MLQLIKRCPEYAEGYKAYCQELYDHNVVFFRPSNPKYLEDDWFERTKDWYEQKEKGLVEGQPVSFHYWAVDDGRFIGEFGTKRPRHTREASARWAVRQSRKCPEFVSAKGRTEPAPRDPGDH